MSLNSCTLSLIKILRFVFLELFSQWGFWLRTDTYQEQPDVSFKYDYVLIADNTSKERLIMCSNLPHLIQVLRDFNYCPVIKVQENDLNRDGLKDGLYFSSEIALLPGQEINDITLLLFFDYKLSSYCQVQMEVMAVLQQRSAGGGASLSVTADLSLAQRRPLSPARPHTTTDSATIRPTSLFHLTDVIQQYSLRNVSARLTKEYATWGYGRVPSEPFLLTANVQYAEATVRYTPSPSQALKFAWMQFFPVLVISILVFRAIKNFIFTNQLVYTYKEVPWKEIH